MSRAWLLVSLGALLLSSGCARKYPSPFTARDMAAIDTGDALVHYLGQPGATAAVCDRRSDGPRFLGKRAEDWSDLAGGLVDARVKPELWQRCTMLLLETSSDEEGASLLDAMAHAYRTLLSRSAIEADEGEKARVEALHRAFLLRRRGTSPHAAAIADDVAGLRAALEKGKLGPVASRYGREVLATIDLEHGLWKGAPLTVASLDELAKDGDEANLRMVMLRVPDEAIRTEARRRIVRLHVAASQNDAVRGHAAEVEAVVMETGRNAVDTKRRPPSAAWLDPARAKVKGVLVRQDVWKQTSTLLAYEGDRPGNAILPSIDLRGALFARVDGVKEPVTVCASPDTLDVTPCLLPAEVKPKVPIVYVDPDGLLHFVERVASKDALRLVYDTPNLPLPFDVGGKTLLTVEWPIVFERPDDVVFNGPPSGRGPDIKVVIERRYSPRLLFNVDGPAGKLVGVVEPGDLAGFSIATRGGAGTPGTRGMDGSNGSSGSPGMSASCPGSPGGNGGNGTAGGNGTSGGPGGPGGPGGSVVVNVACVTGDCGGVTAVVQKSVRSEGGPGGRGGEGGRGGMGGSGGSGGSGTSCTDSQGHSTFVSGGSPGMQGSNGSSGSRGADGSRGAPGKVELHVAQ
ncbi:MAG TPA: hypothetical protein VIF09_05655 [Polyangiaceae bacterium]